MAKLNAIIKGIAEDIVQVQEILDYESALAIHQSREDEIQKTISISKPSIEDIDFSFRFSLLGITEEEIDGNIAQVMDVDLNSNTIESLPNEAMHELTFTLAIDPVEVIGDPESQE